MDWIPKNHLHWDWEALLPFSGKEAEVSKLVQQPDWNDRPSINYGIGNESGGGACCSSEFGNGSPRSSISASTGSPSKASPLQAEVITRKFNFEPVQQSPKDLKKNRDLTKGEATIFSEVAALDGHMEQLIGLKLGKRTYFEDVYGATSITNSSSLAAMNPLTGLGKKVKVPQQKDQSLCCQVEGCNLDLTSAKDYHRKHRVCETHSKSPMVIVAGQERRFCQQCSRFHGLSEFDQNKRSCRRRLSDHNARRRKPQPDTFSFSSSRFSASYFDERQPTTLNFGSASFNEVANMGCSTWNDSGGFKLIPTKESWINSNKSKGINRLHLPCIGLPNTASTVPYNSERLMLFKGAAAKFMDKDALVPGLGAPVAAAYSDGASDLRRALSLLSNEYWAPPNVEHVSDIQFVNVNTIAAQSANHPTNVATGVWQQDELPLAKALPFSLQSNDGQFHEYQMHKTPNLEATFFDSTQIH